jgi:carbohydrate-selective porin OprB
MSAQRNRIADNGEGQFGSFGFGRAYTALDTGDMPAKRTSFPLALNSNELMLQWYYQMKIMNGSFFQAALTEIRTPGLSGSLPNALAVTLRMTVLF